MSRGSKRQKGSGWELRYKGHSRTVRAAGARSAATMLKDFCDEIDAAGIGAYKATNLTVPELVDRWIRNHSPNLAGSTIETYEMMAKHVRRHFPKTLARNLTPADLNDFYAALRVRGLQPATIQKVHIVLRKTYSDARDEGIFWGEPPTVKAKPPKLRRQQMDIPTIEEVHKLLAAADKYSPEIGALTYLGVHTGMRRGELCALRWSRLNLKEGSLMVTRSLSQTRSEGAVEKATKTDEPRQIEFGSEVVERMKSYRRYVEERAEKCAAKLDPNGYVFATDIVGAEPYLPSSVTMAFRRIREKAKLRYRLHDMRHFHISLQLANGVDIRTVAHRAGHKQTSTTLNTYAHVMPAKDREAHKTFADALARKKKSKKKKSN